jgi:hypothetical protein
VSQFDHDTGHSVRDLRIDRAGEDVGYVEVVADWDEDFRAMDSMLHGGNDELALEGPRYDWWVWPAVGASIKVLRSELSALLRELEVWLVLTLGRTPAPGLTRGQAPPDRLGDRCLGVEIKVAGRE